MLNNPDAVAFIYAVGGLAFLLALFVGAVSTISRVVYYRLHGYTRPRLLTRDAVVYGGLALSFGQITVIRFLPTEQRIALTANNVIWALSTTVPAVIAVLTYVYFELRVIERGARQRRDDAA